MILRSLKDYYDRLVAAGDEDIPKFGFARQKVHFCLVLNPRGELVAVQDLRSVVGNRIVPLELIVPEPVKRTVGIAANFLWDNTGYVLGADNKGRPDRALQAFEVFRRYQHLVGDGLEDDGMKAVLEFLDSWKPAGAPDLPYWDEMQGLNLVFRLDSEPRYVHERRRMIEAWSKDYEQSESGIKGMCLVTGSEAPVARLHPALKGIPGAQPSGASLVSFNLDAFTSYGKDQNYNAPIAERAAFAYCTALNWLLRHDSRQKVRIADSTVVFWAERKTMAETLLADLLNSGPGSSHEEMEDQTPVRDLGLIFRAARDGRIQDAVDEPDVAFYVLGLSPNASRLSVRFWHVSTAGDVVANIARHFRDMEIVRSFERDPDYPAVWRVLEEIAVQGKIENISPLLAGAFTRSVLAGAPYPQNLFTSILMRIRADCTINTLRAGLIKACLLRNYDHKEISVSLDSSNTNVGYRLGRLFAVLERVQTAANPNINATIRDKYFGSAAATPRNIFPMLLNLGQQHLGKLRRDTDKKGFAISLDTRIEDILSSLDASPLPAYLSPENQGMFALGYYHQRQHLFSGKQKKTQEE
jgi:CRISPR-associated protein Csd1